MAGRQVDINENEIFELSPDLLNMLLKDQTLSTETEQVNIFWATDSYAHLGENYQYGDKIKIEAITGVNGNIIVPRALKSREQQKRRKREKAEVFTPSWICNLQNNLIDNSWFGKEGVFNTEIEDASIIKAKGLPGNPSHSWIVNTEKVEFPEGKTWLDYVKDNRLEITCGEAPYLASRYDAVSGEFIPVERRIGLLDRKLRVVSENTETSDDWIKAAQAAYKSTYGFEWQGDNIVLARESLLYTFIDNYRAKFGKKPQLDALKHIAYIISWNIWQMDGLKGVIPNSCHSLKTTIKDLFGEVEEKITPCKGCKENNMKLHNGIYALINDWEAGEIIRFVDLLKNETK